MFDSANLVPAFLLTIGAGLSTGIGSAIAFFTNKTNTKFLSIALGFSAGVMLYVAFVEILAKSKSAFVSALGDSAGAWASAAAFFGGMLVIALIDKLVPEADNPHEVRRVEEMNYPLPAAESGLLRTGILSALAISIHNFPEGLATFMSAMENPALGSTIAVAVAIHNIPEGIAVSVPIYFATGSRKKAFVYSFLSGLTEPVGALLGYIILLPYFNQVVFGALFASVAGIMVFISLDELLPSAREYGEHHLAIYGLVAGMVVIAVSLMLLI
ncbi:MAG: zinc transporter ZupT [Dissulfurispiraceae bacterium]|jgi:ZIP family zinc transporter|nr:zinc transporter ZupT [Dissulfurispiraceae bacterium]